MSSVPLQCPTSFDPSLASGQIDFSKAKYTHYLKPVISPIINNLFLSNFCLQLPTYFSVPSTFSRKKFLYLLSLVHLLPFPFGDDIILNKLLLSSFYPYCSLSVTNNFHVAKTNGQVIVLILSPPITIKCIMIIASRYI